MGSHLGAGLADTLALGFARRRRGEVTQKGGKTDTTGLSLSLKFSFHIIFQAHGHRDTHGTPP